MIALALIERLLRQFPPSHSSLEDSSESLEILSYCALPRRDHAQKKRGASDGSPPLSCVSPRPKRAKPLTSSAARARAAAAS
jgi:hypothetical protein